MPGQIKVKKLKKLLKRTAKYLLLPLLLLVLGAAIASSYLVDVAKDINDNTNWFGSENGIDQEDYVTLGGFDQYIRIRGRDKANPVLLDLHGGPGGAQSGFTHRALRPLTEYFTLVEWDQRGAGKSSGDDSEALVATMSYQRMVDDTIELIEHLKTRLSVERVILVGHSWGTLLGLGVIHQRPDLIAAYVGVGQCVAWRPNFDETRRLMINAAEMAGDNEILKNLKALPDQWPPKEDFEANINYIKAIQENFPHFGGGIHALKEPDVLKSDIIVDALLSPDISLMNMISVFEPSKATEALMTDLYDLDIRKELGYQYQVPIFMFQGEHDWQTPTTLVKPWFSRLEAPYKEYIAFEDSAHVVIGEEPGKYLLELVTKVRPFAMSAQ